MTSDSTAVDHGEGPDTAGTASSGAHTRFDTDLVRRRYGGARSRTSRRVQWLVPLVGALALLAGAVWLSVQMSGQPNVEVEHVGYTVEGTSEVQVRFVVVADPGTEVVCTLRAVNTDFTEVGARDVTIGPVTEQRTSAEESVTTSERAASGHAESCRPASE
ncbi:MAG: DUF4307 domain-containing protein [Actinomycetaceae bacterium]